MSKDLQNPMIKISTDDCLEFIYPNDQDLIIEYGFYCYPTDISFSGHTLIIESSACGIAISQTTQQIKIDPYEIK